MIQITKIQTYGWEAAFRGMRNSRQSWHKSDSLFQNGSVSLGPNDIELASTLSKLGGSHAKFRRMIGVSMDILAPRYWWTEFDTYKVGTVSNSTSTMYSITDKPFSIDQFSVHNPTSATAAEHLIETVNMLNELRDMYFEAMYDSLAKMYWYDIIDNLPQSYNQLRTVSMNYEVLSHIVKERKNHRLDEWNEFRKTILMELPYAKELIFGE